MDKVTLTDVTIKRFGAEEVTLALKPWQVKWLAPLKDKPLTVEVKEAKAKRTVRQNALLWALISEIDLTENGRTSEQGECEIYANLIKIAGVSKVIYQTTHEALEETRKRNLFRYIEVIEEEEQSVVWRGYYGSSTFDTVEMNNLLETAKDYAANLGIRLEEY